MKIKNLYLSSFFCFAAILYYVVLSSFIKNPAMSEPPSYVKIGNQVWLNSLLSETKLNNGSEIAFASNSETWKALCDQQMPAYCYLGFDSTNKRLGLIYNFFVISHADGLLLPKGFSIPNAADWKQLMTIDIASLKSDSGWKDGASGTNSSGFNAIPNGFSFNGSSFTEKGTMATWWAAFETPLLAHIGYQSTSLELNNGLLYTGAFLKLVKK
jgi:uncharacterized protein (TIGR02145 family)